MTNCLSNVHALKLSERLNTCTLMEQFWGDLKRGPELYGTTPGLAEMEDETGTEGISPPANGLFSSGVSTLQADFSCSLETFSYIVKALSDKCPVLLYITFSGTSD